MKNDALKVWFSPESTIPVWNPIGFYRFKTVDNPEKADIHIPGNSDIPTDTNIVKIFPFNLMDKSLRADEKNFVYFDSIYHPFVLEARHEFRTLSKEMDWNWFVPEDYNSLDIQKICAVISVITDEIASDTLKRSISRSGKNWNCTFTDDRKTIVWDLINMKGYDKPMPEGDSSYYFWLDIWESIQQERGSLITSSQWLSRTQQLKELLYG